MGRLQAGVGMATITPPVGFPMHCLGLRKGLSEGIHDDLKAKAAVLTDGDSSLAVVALDVVLIPSTLAAEIRRRVTDLTGIGGDRVMLACSHDHTTPDFPDRVASSGSEGYDRYRALFVDLVAGAVSEAYHNLEPAFVGSGVGKLAGWSTNRRHPERPVDDSVGVVRIDDQNGDLLCCLLNFTAHSLAVGGQYLWWTADYPGYAAQIIEQTHPGAACLFLQGAEGDVLPFDWYFGLRETRFPATYESAQKIGNALGGEALKILQSIETTDTARLATSTVQVALPGRTVPWTEEEAVGVVAEMEAANPDWRKETWPPEMHHGNSALLAPGYYRVHAANAQLGIVRTGPGDVQAEVQVFVIGDACLAAVPCELFNALGSEIKKASPFSTSILVGCANGSIGYVPAERDYQDLEGILLIDLVDGVRYRYLYGVATSKVNPGAGELLVKTAGEMISALNAPVDTPAG